MTTTDIALAVAEHQRVSRIAVAGIIAALVQDDADAMGRVRRAQEAAHEFYARKPGPRTKRDRYHRDIIGRAASILDEVVDDVQRVLEEADTK